jgi:hypothetical protein
LNANDISYDGVEADAAVSYNPRFGKIYTGDQFKVLFTLMNTSSSYALENMKMKVIIQRQN